MTATVEEAREAYRLARDRYVAACGIQGRAATKGSLYDPMIALDALVCAEDALIEAARSEGDAAARKEATDLVDDAAARVLRAHAQGRLEGIEAAALVVQSEPVPRHDGFGPLPRSTVERIEWFQTNAARSVRDLAATEKP